MMMLKRLSILAALALLVAGCEKQAAEAPETPGDNHALTFTYESYRSAHSRAIAQDHEKVVHDLDIFAFAADGTYLGQLAPDTDYTETDNGDNTTTVSATLAFLQQHVGQTVTFYFVGNNAASLTTSASAATRHIASFSGTESQFRELLSQPLADSWDGLKAEYIQFTPTSGGLLMTGREVVELTSKVSRAIELRRRTARFDIVNPSPDNFKITAIYVSDAAVQGPMFGNATGQLTPTYKSLVQIDGPRRADNAHVQYDAENRAAGLFYLYPTTTATTKIVIQGYFGANTTKKYNFPVVGDIDIVANNRYTLQFDEQTAEIIVNPGDYQDGDGNIIIVGP